MPMGTPRHDRHLEARRRGPGGGVNMGGDKLSGARGEERAAVESMKRVDGHDGLRFGEVFSWRTQGPRFHPRGCNPRNPMTFFHAVSCGLRMAQGFESNGQIFDTSRLRGRVPFGIIPTAAGCMRQQKRIKRRTPFSFRVLSSHQLRTGIK